MLARHWNYNLMCAVDVETTGLNPFKHEVIQVAAIPLTYDYQVNKDYEFFYVKIKPEKIRDIDIDTEKITKGLVVDCINNGMERWTAVERFQEWFEGLKLPPKKQIIQLGANCQFDRDFLREWLGGYENFEYHFRSDFRDVQKVALALNDMAHYHSEPIPFPKWNLTYLATTLGVEYRQKHDALADSLCAAEVYKNLMRYRPPHASPRPTNIIGDEQDGSTRGDSNNQEGSGSPPDGVPAES